MPGCYWILGIKCGDTTGVGLVYWNSELKSGQGHTPISKKVVIRRQAIGHSKTERNHGYTTKHK